MRIMINGAIWNTAAPTFGDAKAIRDTLEHAAPHAFEWVIYRTDRSGFPRFVVVPNNLGDDDPLLTLQEKGEQPDCCTYHKTGGYLESSCGGDHADPVSAVVENQHTYRCLECGSPDVQVSRPAWADPNRGDAFVDFDSEADALSCWCNQCQRHVTLQSDHSDFADITGRWDR